MPPVWSRANEAERLRQSLAGWLALVDASGLTSKQTTKLLTDSISEWAVRRRWQVELEAPALVERMSVNGPMRGRLDLLCTRRWRRSAVAIEIDRAKQAVVVGQVGRRGRRRKHRAVGAVGRCERH